MNQLMSITVERDDSTNYWVFDDLSRGLQREPLVMGADRILDEIRLDEHIAGPGVPDTLILTFSGQNFPGAQYTFERREHENGGFWYYWPQGDRRGWLCPALFKYFDQAPEKLHMHVRQSPDTDFVDVAAFEVEGFRAIQELERRLSTEARFTLAEMRQWRDRLRKALEGVDLL